MNSNKRIFKKIASVFLRISISIILLIFLFHKVNIESLFEIIENADKGNLFFAFFIMFFNYLLCLFRWQMLLKATRLRIPFKRIIISFSGGIFFNLFLPSAIGGDLVRSIDLSVHTNKPSEVLATVFLDRLSGYIGMVILVLSALFFGWEIIRDRSLFLIMGLLTATLILILLILFNQSIYTKVNQFLGPPNKGKIRELLRDIHQEIHLFREDKRIIVTNLLLSLVIQATGPLAAYFVILSFGLKINIIYFFILVPIVGAISMLPVSIGGLGLRDAGAVFFFAKVGVGQDIALAMSLLTFFFILIYGGIGGLVYVLTVHHRRLQYHPSS